MKKFKLFTIFLIMTVFLLSPLTCFADEGEPFSVEAGAAMLVDMKTGEVLFEQNADERMFPASLTKVMTCLLAAELGDMNAQVTAQETAFADLIDAGSTADIQPGEVLSLSDLIYCAMLPSANEACNIIAEYISGSIPAFVELMNQKAADLGCTGTHFVNCHGLHNEDHYTTARDMTLIARAAFSNPLLRSVAGTPEHTVPATNLSEERIIESTDQLISDSINGNYLYEYAVAGKTGYTTPAGRCLVSCAAKDDKELLSVVMKTDSVPLDDGSTRVMSFYETIRMMEYGFSHWSYQTLLAKGTPITETDVKLGDGADSVVLCAGAEITYLLPADFDAEQVKKVITVYNEGNITAPVEKGQELGLYELYDLDGTAMGSVPLVALTQIERSVPEAVVTAVRDTVAKPWLKALAALIVIIIIALVIYIFIKRMAAKRRHAQELNRRRSQDVRRRQEEQARRYNDRR